MKDGDTLDLGDKTLEFISAPFLHWPDTMFTYSVEDGVLFPCDSFGCHYADERMFDDLVDDFEYAYRYYFDMIMRPFKEHVIKATDKLPGKTINVICPSHGPVLRTNPSQYIDKYRAWSMPEAIRKSPACAPM